MAQPSLKRGRSPSMAKLDEPVHKHQHKNPDVPLLSHSGESKSEYFKKLSQFIDKKLFHPTSSFHADGIFLYKRPVRAADKNSLLSQAGSVFHHVVVYVRENGILKALEFGPNNGMDITGNILSEATPGSIVNVNPEMPEDQHLPMLYINHPHHSLDSDHIQKAIKFAESKPYQALKNNCIVFADFITRLLTGGSIKNAPLIFDSLCGSVPDTDSPLLSLLAVMAQMTWFHVVDGSRLVTDFIRVHTESVVPVVIGIGNNNKTLQHAESFESLESERTVVLGEHWGIMDDGGNSNREEEAQKPAAKGGLKALPPRPSRGISTATK